MTRSSLRPAAPLATMAAMRRIFAFALLAAALLLAAGAPRGSAAASSAPSYCSRTGTPLAAPVVGGGSFGFSVSTDDKASTIAVGQPDATDGAGLVYNYNQVALCAYQSFELPRPSAAAGAAPPSLLGMMAALSRDGRYMAVAGTLKADGARPQVFIYRRQSNDSTGGFVLLQKLSLSPPPTVVNNSTTTSDEASKVYAGSLSISRDGRLVLVSWSVYGAGQAAGSDDPYGAPSPALVGSAQLFRRQPSGRWARTQADFVALAPPLTRTQFFGANSYVVADGTLAAVSTRAVDATRPDTGAPAVVVYQRTSTGAFVHAHTLRVPGSDGTFAMTESGSHLAVVRGTDVVVFVREGAVADGKFVYNKRCTLPGDDMNLEANYTKMAIAVAYNTTLRLAIGNSLDSVFVWSIPLGGKRAYSDGTCPAVLDAALTGDSGTQFGAAVALAENGKTLVVGAPGSASSPDATVLVADIALPKGGSSGGSADGSASVPATATTTTTTGTSSSGGLLSGSNLAGALYTTKASSAAALDSSYFATNPSTVLVSPRRGSVGVPAAQTFSAASWAAGSPGGAPYAGGYSIAPVNPYMSGGTSVQQTVVAVTAALRGIGLTTAAVRNAAVSARTAYSGGLATG